MSAAPVALLRGGSLSVGVVSRRSSVSMLSLCLLLTGGGCVNAERRVGRSRDNIYPFVMEDRFEYRFCLLAQTIFEWCYVLFCVHVHESLDKVVLFRIS